MYVPDVLYLTTGTEMNWQVRGGTNFWNDYNDKYQVNWSVESRDNSDSKNCLSIKIAEEYVTRFDIGITCNAQSDQQADLDKVNKLQITMVQSSQKSRHLIKPA
jgi:hypothetical protein